MHVARTRGPHADLALRSEGVLAVCFGTPALVMVLSYIWLSVEHGTPWLWGVVVHESGRYTLGETILYFSHFLREVPIVVAYVLFLLGSSGAASPSWAERWHAARLFRPAALVLAGLLVIAALVGTAASEGWSAAILDLLQYRTRDDLAGYGTHWRYHWLSTVWFGAVLGVAPAVLNRLLGGAALAVHRSWLVGAWAYVLVLTIAFGLSADVFTDVRYVGHQAREILTHGPVTILLGVGILLIARPRATEGEASSPALLPGWMATGLAGLVLLIPAYLALVSLSGDVMEHGQSEYGLAAMVAAHYFEHTLDYLLASLLLFGALSGVHSRSRLQAPNPPDSREDRSHARP